MSKPTFVVLFCAPDVSKKRGRQHRASEQRRQPATGTTPPWISNLQKEFGAQHYLRFRFPGTSPRRHGGRVPVLWKRIVGGRRKCSTRLCNPGPESGSTANAARRCVESASSSRTPPLEDQGHGQSPGDAPCEPAIPESSVVPSRLRSATKSHGKALAELTWKPE